MNHLDQLPQLHNYATLAAMPHTDWGKRREYVKERGWFLLSYETALDLARCLKHRKVIEVGAGSGHLAAHLRKLGVKDYKAYDINLLTRGHGGYQFYRNFGVMHRNALQVNIKSADAIVMTWPNYDDNFAYRIAKKMRPGQWLFYQGEWRGCTACDKFHDLLQTDFREVGHMCDRLNKYQVNWQGIRDQWFVFRKK